MNLLLSLVIIASGQYTYFDNDTLYQAPLAFVRSPISGVSVKKFNYNNDKVIFVEAVIAKEVPLVTYHYNEDLKFQFGVEGAGWLSLAYDDWTFPLLTGDYLFGFPLAFSYKGFSGSFKVTHISAHQGDGFGYLEENRTPLGYSREYISAHLDYTVCEDNFSIRFYGRSGFNFHITPDVGKSFFGFGSEIRYMLGTINPVFAHDLSWNEDTLSVDYSGKFGTMIADTPLGIFISVYSGKDRRGQLIGNRLEEIGIGFVLR